jgi:UDP-N-acetylglucosamine--N-acetylmuramyl-(pentapeptide) pyrophosphoryl-undecaprenol N-acetylglucosamine transferase
VRVLLAGGGTAGHTSPLIATADALSRRVPDIDIVCLGTERGIETRVIPAAGYRLELIAPVPLPRRLSGEVLTVPRRLWGSVSQTREVIRRHQPDVVVGFGGYVSTPVYLVARRHRIPLVVHEGNALPGLANRLGARCTRHVATSFPDTPLPYARMTGLPLRRAISTLDRAAVRDLALAHFGLAPQWPTLLVTGGSQGAQRLNDSVGAAAAELAEAGVQVLHVSGPRGSVERRPAEPGEPAYVVVPYVDQMELAYAAADVVVGRAGAGSVTEAAALGLPAVFVPLPIGNGEQARNAASVVAAGGALLVDNADFTPDWVRHNLPALLTDRRRLDSMSQAAADLVPRDGDEALAQMILEAAT